MSTQMDITDTQTLPVTLFWKIAIIDSRVFDQKHLSKCVWYNEMFVSSLKLLIDSSNVFCWFGVGIVYYRHHLCCIFTQLSRLFLVVKDGKYLPLYTSTAKNDTDTIDVCLMLFPSFSDSSICLLKSESSELNGLILFSSLSKKTNIWSEVKSN